MASLAALQRVLSWAAEQGMSVRDQLTEAQIVALERVFRGATPWSFERYPELRAFAHALARLNLPDLPALLNFADVLQALDELRSAEVAAWPTHEAVADDTFSQLGYASTSVAITRIRNANASAWHEHATHNRRFLLHATAGAIGTRAVVIGAGKLYDIPLLELAERFEQVLLVDIDAAALAASVAEARLEPKLHARLALVQTDVTGITDVFLDRARAALAPADEGEVYAGLLRLLYDYRVDEPPRLFPASEAGSPIDFACSSMVLSQLATPLTQYIEERFAARFPASPRTRALEFQIALGQFTHRVQQAHVLALLATAPRVALSSDIADQYAGLDLHGSVIRGPALALIGAPSLDALVPRRQARAVSTATWQWQHVVPTPSKPHGRTVQVSGVVAERS